MTDIEPVKAVRAAPKITLAAFAACCLAHGPAPLQAQSPRFDVASVKPCKADDGGRGGSTSGDASPGRLDLKCRTVMGLIQMAYVQYADGVRTPPGRHDGFGVF